MQLRNETRDTLNLNLSGGESLMLIGKKSITIDCRLDLLEEQEVKDAIKKGQVRVIHGERMAATEKLKDDPKKKGKKKDKKKSVFGKKTDGTED